MLEISKENPSKSGITFSIDIQIKWSWSKKKLKGISITFNSYEYLKISPSGIKNRARS